MQYAIAAHTWNNVDKKLARIARKCKKYGSDFVIEVKGEEVRRVYNAQTEQHCNVRFVLVEVEGECKCGDWQAVAQLDMRSSGNIIRMIDTKATTTETYRNTPNVCDHCGTARPRKNLYVLRNNATGEYKQVGSTCLKDYCGLDLEAVVAWRDGLDMLESYDGVCVGSYTDWEHCETVERIIAVACVVTDAIGYRNTCYDGLTTKAAIGSIIFNGGYEGLRKVYGIVLDGKAEESDEIKERVAAIIEHYATMETTSDFAHNIQTILKDGVAEYKDLGYLGYLPTGYAKDIEKQQRIEAAKKESESVEYFGEIGKRYKDVAIKSARLVTSWKNYYGCTNLYRIEIEGSVLIWKTSKDFDTDELESITFTVKDHNEYRGVKQTEVTRCKVA